MKNLSIIAAIGPNLELGYNNELIWHLKEDLAFYKRTTLHKYIIMGRVTLETLPPKALIDRKPIVLTSQPYQDKDNIKYFNSIEELLKIIEQSNEEYIVIGGATIYKQFIPFVDTMYLTNIEPLTDTKIEADTYFPTFNQNNWHTEILQEGIEKETSYKIKKYTRKR